MVFSVQKASQDNVNEIAELLLSVSTSPRLLLEFGACNRDNWLQWYIQTTKYEIGVCERLGDEEAQALVVVDSEAEGRIAGFAVWVWSDEAANLIDQEKSSIPLPQGTNLSLRRSFTSALHTLEEKYRPGERHFELFDLATSPEYQRRGIASMLLGHGLEKADKEGVNIFLSASPSGAMVYPRLGFVELGELSLELQEFGGEEGERHVHKAMIRMPRSVGQNQRI